MTWRWSEFRWLIAWICWKNEIENKQWRHVEYKCENYSVLALVLIFSFLLSNSNMNMVVHWWLCNCYCCCNPHDQTNKPSSTYSRAYKTHQLDVADNRSQTLKSSKNWHYWKLHKCTGSGENWIPIASIAEIFHKAHCKSLLFLLHKELQQSVDQGSPSPACCGIYS